MTTQGEIAFILELVAEALEGSSETDPGMAVSDRLRSMAETLKAAPPSDGFVWCESHDYGPCVYHPLGGPDCAM